MCRSLLHTVRVQTRTHSGEAKKEPLMRDYVEFHPKKRSEWRAWLRGNHSKSPGIWLVYFKKESGKPRVTYDEAVKEALCFGWIDSLARTLDAQRSKLLFTPRKPKSGWSKINKQRIEELVRELRMTRAGLDRIEAARRDGSWTRLDATENLRMPADLEQALRAKPAAKRNLAAFPPSARKGIYWYIESAKRAPTRANRVQKVVRMAAKNLRAGYDKE